MPTVLNAANEVAVHAFIAGEIGFLDIPRIVESTCEPCRLSRRRALSSVEEALAIDDEARQIAREQLPRAARAAT